MNRQIGTRRIDEVGRSRSRQYDRTLEIGPLNPMVTINENIRRAVMEFEIGTTT